MIRKTLYLIGGLVMALFWGGSPLQAQVAAVDLSVGLPRMVIFTETGYNTASFLPDNPAAMMWSKKSQLGGGGINQQVLDEVTNGKLSDSGVFFGGRLIGEAVGLAGGHVELKRSDPVYLYQERNSNLGFAFKVAEGFAFGVAGQASVRTDTIGDLVLDRRTLGVSFNLGDVLFAGLGVNRDRGASLEAGLSETGERTGNMAGLALRSEGSIDWFLELHTVKLNDFSFTTNRPGGFTANSAILQARDDQIMLGLFQTSFVTVDKNDNILSSGVNFAYKPYNNLVYGFSVVRTQDKNSAPTYPLPGPNPARKIQYTTLGFSLGLEY